MSSALEAVPWPSGDGARWPSLVDLGGETLALFYAPSGAHEELLAAKFGAAGWSQPERIAGGSELWVNWADQPGAVRGGDGRLYVWWLERLGIETYAYGVRLAARRLPDGPLEDLGWLHEDRSPVEHGFVSAVPTREGALFFYLDGRETARGGPMQLRWVRVADGSLGSTRLLDSRVCDCCPTSLVAGADGSHYVAFRDRSEEEIRDAAVARLDEEERGTLTLQSGARWRIEGCPVQVSPLVVLSDGFLLAEWTGAGDRARVRTARLDRTGGLRGEIEDLDAREPIGRLAASRTAREGVLLWIGRDGRGAGLVRARRFDAAGGWIGESEALAPVSAGRGSGRPAVAPYPGGGWLIAWTGEAGIQAFRWRPEG